MNNFYTYEGTVSQISNLDRHIVLGDINDWDKAPVMVKVPCEGLHRYLWDRSWTDDEERYLKQTFIYDRNLFLQCIVITSYGSTRPAKVIACAKLDVACNDIEIFGPKDLIDSSEPNAMDNAEMERWYNFRNKNGLYF